MRYRKMIIVTLAVAAVMTYVGMPFGAKLGPEYTAVNGEFVPTDCVFSMLTFMGAIIHVGYCGTPLLIYQAIAFALNGSLVFVILRIVMGRIE